MLQFQKISQISRPRSIERNTNENKLRSHRRAIVVPQPRPPGLIVSNHVSGVARRNGRWKSAVLRARLIPRVISIERTSMGGEVQRGRDSYVRGPLSTQSDDYTRGSRVTIHLVLPLSTLLRTSNGRQKKRILLTSDTANFYGSLDAQKGRMISDLSSRIFC